MENSTEKNSSIVGQFAFGLAIASFVLPGCFIIALILGAIDASKGGSRGKTAMIVAGVAFIFQLVLLSALSSH